MTDDNAILNVDGDDLPVDLAISIDDLIKAEQESLMADALDMIREAGAASKPDSDDWQAGSHADEVIASDDMLSGLDAGLYPPDGLIAVEDQLAQLALAQLSNPDNGQEVPAFAGPLSNNQTNQSWTTVAEPEHGVSNDGGNSTGSSEMFDLNNILGQVNSGGETIG